MNGIDMERTFDLPVLTVAKPLIQIILLNPDFLILWLGDSGYGGVRSGPVRYGEVWSGEAW